MHIIVIPWFVRKRGDNPRVKRVDYLTYRWTTLYHLSVDLAHLGIFCAKVGKGGIKHCQYFVIKSAHGLQQERSRKIV